MLACTPVLFSDEIRWRFFQMIVVAN